jgi:hypothetical protein
MAVRKGARRLGFARRRHPNSETEFTNEVTPISLITATQTMLNFYEDTSVSVSHIY